jgi:uncharacterized coiled-coil protein SlyX
METENISATIAEIIDTHRQIPHNGGWTCAAKDCPWTYDDSPLPLAESAKHQADVIAKTLHPVAAPSVEQIESVLGEHIHPGDVSSTPVIAEAIHALYGTPGDADRAQSFHEEVMLDARRQAEARVRDLENEIEAQRAVVREQGATLYANGEEIGNLQARIDVLVAELEESDEMRGNLANRVTEVENIARAKVERYKAVIRAQDEQIQLERNASVRIENLHLAENAERQARQRANEHWQELTAARAAVEADTTEEA